MGESAGLHPADHRRTPHLALSPVRPRYRKQEMCAGHKSLESKRKGALEACL
jgi:hypothetical protein